jgi:hypothetical protein
MWVEKPEKMNYPVSQIIHRSCFLIRSHPSPSITDPRQFFFPALKAVGANRIPLGNLANKKPAPNGPLVVG